MSRSSTANGVGIYDSNQDKKTDSNSDDVKVDFLPELQRTELESKEEADAAEESVDETALESSLLDVEAILDAIDEQIKLCNDRHLFRAQDKIFSSFTFDSPVNSGTSLTGDSSRESSSVARLSFFCADPISFRSPSELSSAYSSAYSPGLKSTATTSNLNLSKSTRSTDYHYIYTHNNKDIHFVARAKPNRRQSAVNLQKESSLLDELNECYRKFCASQARTSEKSYFCSKTERSLSKDEADIALSASKLFIDNNNERESGFEQRTRRVAKSPVECESIAVERGELNPCIEYRHLKLDHKHRRRLSLPTALNTLSEKHSEPSSASTTGNSVEAALNDRYLGEDSCCEVTQSCRSTESSSLDLSQVSNEQSSDEYDEDDYCKAFEFETCNALESVEPDLPSLVDDYIASERASCSPVESSSPQLCCSTADAACGLIIEQSNNNEEEESSLSLSWSLEYDFNQQESAHTSLDRSQTSQTHNIISKPTQTPLASQVSAFGGNYKDFWCTLLTNRQLLESSSTIGSVEAATSRHPLEISSSQQRQQQQQMQKQRSALGCSHEAQCVLGSLHKMSTNTNANELDARQHNKRSQRLEERKQQEKQLNTLNPTNTFRAKCKTLKAQGSAWFKDRNHDNSNVLKGTSSSSSSTSAAAAALGSQSRSESAFEQSEISGKQQEDSCDASSSMRSAKDLAKLSMPSLSSLQYLPARTNVKSVLNEYLNADCNDERKGKQRKADLKLETEHTQMADKRRRRAASESKSDVSRVEESTCLLHKICLCTCLARESTAIRRNQSIQALESESNLGDKVTAASTTKTTTSSKKPKNSLSSAAKKQAKRSASQETPTQIEKQSPSFLNLLKADSELCRDDTTQVKTDVSSDLASSHTSNNGESCAHRCDDDAHNEAVSPATRRRSQSYGNESADKILRPRLRQETKKEEAQSHKRSILANCKKIFGGSKENELDSNRNQLLIEQHSKTTKLPNSNRTQADPSETPSFFSRSLHRLSGKSLAKLYGRKKNVRSETSLDAIKCSTPDFAPTNQATNPSITLSVSSIEHNNDDNDSCDCYRPIGSTSPDTGYSGPNSLLLTCSSAAPDIVLHGDTKSVGCSMSPRCSRHNHQQCAYQSSKRSHNDPRRTPSNQTRSPSMRHECYVSESGSMDDISGSFSGSFQRDQWSSLPTSPQMRRRSRRSPDPSSSSSNYGRRSPRLSSSPVPFCSPPTESTKIEDGLKVCSIEHFEKHIDDVKGYQIEAQKRLFTAWINHFCPNLIRYDLIEELQDGIKLIGLLATLANDQKLMGQYEKLVKDKQSYVNRLMVTPSSRLKHLSNVSISIEYLKKQLGMKLVNLNPMDIVSGKANVILGLCWNIILNFQIERNLPKYTSSESSSQISQDSSINSRMSKPKPDSASSINNVVRGVGDLEEYSQKDLLFARNRLLSYINRRFNLKLTNLTSNFVDGDVLRAILKQIIPDLSESCFEDTQKWIAMNEDEKLELCFSIAETYLNVPRLFNPRDLRQQIIMENNSKPLLVYLSMLLESRASASGDNNSTKADQIVNDGTSVDGLSLQQVNIDPTQSTGNKEISTLLQNVDIVNRFDVEHLQNTLTKVKALEELVNKIDADDSVNGSTVERASNLIRETKQIEMLITWINKADELFESTQRSSADLAKAIEKYKEFFSPENIPNVPKSAYCPTLERQYKECLDLAKQRVLSMEQTMKNWINYEKARQELRGWLLEAESRLSNALRPNIGHTDTDEHKAPVKGPIEQYQKCLDDLVDYFELEPVDASDTYEHLPMSTILANSTSHCASMRSLSSSLVSLNSNSSLTSTLTTSRSATHLRLFDNFELKCRLLAAMLDSDQRDALLLGVKELKSRLKYIVEWKVPQVVSELKFNINQCSMSITEQDEPVVEAAKAFETQVEEHSRAKLVSPTSGETSEPIETLPNELKQISSEESKSPQERDNRPDNQTQTQAQPQKNSTSAKRSKSKKKNEFKAESSGSRSKSSSRQSSPVDGEEKSLVSSNSLTEHRPISESRTLFDWFWSNPSKPQLVEERDTSQSQAKTKMSKPAIEAKYGKNQKRAAVKNGSSSPKVLKKNSCEEPDAEVTLAQRLWSKVVRASKASLPFNIVLLICLAGLCVLPLLNKDACCELSQTPIPAERMTITQRPT